MEDDVKAKFRAFADRFAKDAPVLDTGLVGADLHEIADMVESVVGITEIDLRDLGRFCNLRSIS
ncbi:hypothetical protein [Sphingobium yanoikuyae]|uniref:Uncharacterized protein n=1 Tax=Sphingobium yanoikuyae TaxID=13690 RepID=A0A9X7YDC8_SPHYA|nr:hypothetical protein [Sphingobium yanoikuyae]QNG46163.1 hypothetical protein H3V42_00295 [Sphingobium yanoikuyae]